MLWLGAFVLWHKRSPKSQNLSRTLRDVPTGLAAAALYSTVGRRQSIAVPQAEPLLSQVARERTESQSPLPRRRKNCPPGQLLRRQPEHLSRGRRQADCPPPGRLPNGFYAHKTRQPFRRRLLPYVNAPQRRGRKYQSGRSVRIVSTNKNARHHPSARRRPSHCLAASAGPARATPTQATLPHCGIS